MHRSRIGVLLIDHPVASYDDAAAFWASARGSSRGGSFTDEEPYESLEPLAGLSVYLQRTGAATPPRVHLDIETDDHQSEVARLEALGATVVTAHDGWSVLSDPGGMLFCVVPPQCSEEVFSAHATTWD